MLLYRVLLTLAAPLAALRLWRDGPQARDERLARGLPAQAERAARLWLHAASNGEATAARPLIDAMLARDPRLHLLVTCNSLTGRDMVRGWGLERVDAVLAPLDYRPVLRRFIAAWQPEALIVIEGDIWPNRMLAMADRGVIFVSARMSARSAARWGRLPGLAGRVFGAIRLLSAQDAASAERFAALGLPAAARAPGVNLKLGVAPAIDPASARLIGEMGPLFTREETVLAASTHPGEEELVLRAFARARAKRPELRLILAPRHPKRAGEVATLIAREGLGHATRSAGEAPEGLPVYLADTLGEMAAWYALAGVAFIGGSLVPRGGHTPVEPAAFGCAILHGPHVANFAELYAALDRAGGARTVDSADAMATALTGLTADQHRQMAQAASDTLARQGGAAELDGLIDRIADASGVVDMKARADNATPAANRRPRNP